MILLRRNQNFLLFFLFKFCYKGMFKYDISKLGGMGGQAKNAYDS